MMTEGEWTLLKAATPLADWAGSYIIRSPEAPGGIAVTIGGLGMEEEDNARLLAAAKKLLEACQAQHDAIDWLFARLILAEPGFFPSQSGQPWEALIKGNNAIRIALK